MSTQLLSRLKDRGKSEVDGCHAIGTSLDNKMPDDADPREPNYFLPGVADEDVVHQKAERVDLPLPNHAGDCVDHDGWMVGCNACCKGVWSQPIIKHPTPLPRR